MAIITRYFGVTANGLGDGTTWNDRAALFSGGAWSTVITAFNFTSDSLVCLIGPGTYTISVQLQSGLFTTIAPTANNMLHMHGCDASGNKLVPPNPGWTSAEPDWDWSILPQLTSTGTAPLSLSSSTSKLIAWICPSGRTGAVIGSIAIMDWCYVANNTASTTAQVISNGTTARFQNCILKCGGTSYDSVVVLASSALINNCRVVGNLSATSGNRRGITLSGTTTAIRPVNRCTVINNIGEAIIDTNTSTSHAHFITRNMIVNNGAGIVFPTTAAQISNQRVMDNFIINCSGNAIDGGPNSNVMASHNRMRNNGANIVNCGNYPIDWDNDTSAGSDGAEFMDAGDGDYRIRSDSVYYNQGYGPSDQMIINPAPRSTFMGSM